MIRPNFQRLAGSWSSFKITKSPTLGLTWVVSHFGLCCNRCRNSVLQRFQKSCFSFCSNSHRERRLIGMNSKSGSGKDINERPMRKWAGVRAVRSLGSIDMGERGLELRTASIWERIVLNSSKVNKTFPITRLKWNLIDFTPASHNPPKWGAEGGLKCHVKLLANE